MNYKFITVKVIAPCGMHCFTCHFTGELQEHYASFNQHSELVSCIDIVGSKCHSFNLFHGSHGSHHVAQLLHISSKTRNPW